MGANKRHCPEKSDRVQEAIRQSRERKRRLQDADEKSARVYEAIAGIVQRRSDKLGAAVHAVFAYRPGTKFKRGEHRRAMAKAARLVWQLANELGIPLRIEVEHVHLNRREETSPASEGPRRHRGYDLPSPSSSFDWDPVFDRICYESTPLDEEVASRLRAARDQNRCSDHRPGAPVLAGLLDSSFASPVVEQRIAHHPSCASRHPVLGVVRKTAAGELFHPLGTCDCGFLVLRRFGALTVSIERHGWVRQIHATMLTRDRIRFVDCDRGEHPGDESGFVGELATDNSGMVLAPWDRPFIEFGDGSISFADAGIRRKHNPKEAT
jgi:hypothetical protein